MDPAKVLYDTDTTLDVGVYVRLIDELMLRPPRRGSRKPGAEP